VARIPQEFRIDAAQVEISRGAYGDLVIHPLPLDRGAALLSARNAFDEDFVALFVRSWGPTKLNEAGSCGKLGSSMGSWGQVFNFEFWFLRTQN
jgi:virulence-associated protein VagC